MPKKRSGKSHNLQFNYYFIELGIVGHSEPGVKGV